MKMRKTISTIVILVVTLSFLSCRQNQNEEAIQVIEEIQKKEEELEKIKVPSFLLKDQEETNVTTMTSVATQETQISPSDLSSEDQTIKKQKINQLTQKITEKQKVEVSKYPFEKETLTKYNSKKTISSGKPQQSHKVYFSYKNGYKYISSEAPGKITTVLNVPNKVWYIDYNIYAIQAKNINRYKNYMIKKYLIGIGRNISVYNNQSQLTVYWTGKNLNKSTLPKGKYIIVSSVFMKDKNKKVIARSIKILGQPSNIIYLELR